MFWWGVAKTYQIPFVVAATSWTEVKEKRKARLEKCTKKTASQIIKSVNKVRPGIKSKFIFSMMKAQQKGMAWNPVDQNIGKITAGFSF